MTPATEVEIEQIHREAKTASVRGSVRSPWLASQLPKHPARNECPTWDCLVCAFRDCPQGDPTHYDSTGCWAEEGFMEYLKGLGGCLDAPLGER